MYDGLAVQYLAECAEKYRREVVYPAAALRSQQEADLRLLRQARRNASGRINPLRRLRDRLAGIGTHPNPSQTAPGA